ncbi:hypothetical protein KAH27_00685, partial [bacterium]|nr:hypothetical protein [bacterium]
MKKYNKIPLAPFIKGGIITALTILFACSNLLAAVLFEDNFNSLNSGNINTDLSERQSGSLADISYIVGWDNNPAAYVTNAGPYAGKAFLGQNSHVALQHNFTDSGNYSIEFELDWARTNINGALHLAVGKEFEWGMGPWHPGGFGITFRSYGFYTMWINGTEYANFAFPELVASSNQIFKIKLCVSQTGFPPPDNQARVALFIDDKPYPLGISDSNPYFIYNLTSDLTNNYIGFTPQSYDTPPNEVFIDNLIISSGENSISTKSWSNDSDSVISSSKNYSHAVNLADVSTTINGVAFTGSPSNLMSGANWQIRKEDGGGYGNYNITDFGYAPNISGSSLALSTNILFDLVNSGCLTLSGLNTGKKYNLAIYSVGMDYGLGGVGTA